MSNYQVLSLRMYIQKADGSVQPAQMGIKKDDWEMPNKPDDVSIFKMFEK